MTVEETFPATMTERKPAEAVAGIAPIGSIDASQRGLEMLGILNKLFDTLAACENQEPAGT